jgi:hypothetical protein
LRCLGCICWAFCPAAGTKSSPLDTRALVIIEQQELRLGILWVYGIIDSAANMSTSGLLVRRYSATQ